ncbi:MAG: 2-amino-4-hydroxy-6-hydroxymethyldihydropteridine diphosphokinase [Bacteroidota bacterium]
MTSGIFVLLGSNMGDKEQNLTQAKIYILDQIGKVMTESSIYQTAAWGKEDQPVFYNQVLQIQTGLSALELLYALLKIEKLMGRKRIEKWGERIIDLDLLYYHNEVIETKDLKVPHPGIPERKFTLIPLVEIAAEFLHPSLGRSQQELLNLCGDQLNVLKLN